MQPVKAKKAVMKKNLFYFAILSTLLFSCQKDNIGVDKANENTALKFLLEVETPKEVNLKSVKPEDVINSIDILEFDENNRFIQRLLIDNVQLRNGVYSFFAQLTTTTEARTLHIVANARDTDNNDRVNLTSLVAGVSLESTIAELKTKKLTTKFIPEITPHIMWGKVRLSSISNGMTVPNIKLIRSVASISLELDANVAGEFALIAFSVHKTATYGMLTPLDIRTSNIMPATPHLPAELAYITPDPCWDITDHDRWVFSSDYKKCEDLYIYENTGATIGDEGLSFIIRGAPWGASQSFFYRVSPLAPNGQPMKFVRNHKYKMKIIRVDGKGYTTQDGAVNNPPSNIHVEIIDEESDFTNVVTDGTNVLGTNVNQVHIYASTFTDINVLNYFTANENAMYSGCGSPVDYLSWSKTQISSVNNITKYKALLSLTGTLPSSNEIITGAEVKANNGEGWNSGLIIKVPMTIVASNRLTTLSHTEIISASNNFKTWTVNVLNYAEMQNYIQINGTDLVGLYTGNGNAGVKVSIKNSIPGTKYLYLELNGVTTTNKIIDRQVVLQISNT